MKILFIGILFLSFNTFAEISMFTEVKGIERSVTEAQQIFSTVSLQTKIFFEKESIGLKSIFPEFESKALIKKINETRMEFVNDEDLIDNNGVKRTCLNFPTLLKIKCSVSEFEKFSRTPKAVYVLVLHEYLDLLGVKETVPLIDNMVDEYKI